MSTYSLAIHGGAGTITRNSLTAEKEQHYRDALLEALVAGESILKSGGSALDAVMQAVMSLEDCPLFNAGRGSVFTATGQHEMDASIMRGDTLDAGAVAGVKGIKNPVVLARAVMEQSEHVMLSGLGAETFAKETGIAFESEKYFYTEQRFQQLQEAIREGKVQLDHTLSENKKFGTVGAVAKDQQGNLAAATSTGGMTNKKFNRIGDSPIIGAGTYANNKTCAVSCTGHGEFFIRAVVAYDISCLMEYKGLSLEEACRIVVHDKLVKSGGEGGLIAVDYSGNISLPFNSEGMYRGWLTEKDRPQTAIYKE
ncbi:MAG: isoaspartyl peptidase/L-asparaginase [Bacteroidetes bacterium]|nr:isoaspartyl peptidase/L-asparaginase [Bacteroidota bacterium]